MITRYTSPEQFSSRVSLQLSPINGSDYALSRWTELHPSRMLPPYAVQSILDIGSELKATPHAQSSRTYVSEADPHTAIQSLGERGIEAPQDLVYTSPMIIEEGIAGESIFSLIELAGARGWEELPTALALGVFISACRGIEYLHALGFSHGGLSSDTIMVRYVGEDNSPALKRVNRGGGVLISDWVRGQLFQLSPHAERYGRGPSADCRALLWVLLEMLGGDSSVEMNGILRAPSCQKVDTVESLSAAALSALEQLPPTFADWVTSSLVSPPKNMQVMLSQLQRVISSNQPAFDAKGASRWLTRAVPERAQQWELLLSSGQAQVLKYLLPAGGILTSHSRPMSNAEPEAVDLHSSNTSPRVVAQGAPLASPPSPIPPGQTIQRETESPADPPKKRAKSKPTPQQPSGSLLERIDARLDAFEGKIQERFAPQKSSTPKLRVAVIWLDTIRSMQDFDLQRPITVGSSEQAMVSLPIQIDGEESITLFTPSGTEVITHADRSATGWISSHTDAQRQSWTVLSDPSMATLSLGGQGIIHYGEFAIYFQLQMIADPPPVWVPKLPIPTKEAGLFWCLALAACMHLALLTVAYGSKSYTFRERGLITTNKFVEVLTKKIEDQKELEEEEEEEEEVTEVTETAEEVYEPTPDLDIPKVREDVRELAKERFGKGKAAVDALADFLAGKADSREGTLALGDVSAALGTSEESGLALGSAFGEAGGSLNIGGGSGSLNTSGGLGGSRKAGQLKAKRVKRRVRGRVKALRSRARITGGKLSKAEVLKVIRKNSAKLNSCYERQLIKSPNLSGKLTVSWVIKTNGRVGGVKQLLSSIKNAPLKSCVFKVIKKMKFPKPKGGLVKVKYPFVFQQG